MKSSFTLLLILLNLTSYCQKDISINITDNKGYKQGLWKVYLPQTYQTLRGDRIITVTDSTIIEMGSYKDNLKEGEWIYYSPNNYVYKSLVSDKSIKFKRADW